MYDNVDLLLSKECTPNTNFMSEIPVYLENISLHNFNNGMTTISGYLGNLKVFVNEMSVKVKNSSLCKYYLGDNFQTLQRSDTANIYFELLRDLKYCILVKSNNIKTV